MKNKKINVYILGATGLIGQAFVKVLSDHPEFEIVGLAGSKTGIGEKYRDSVNWKLPVNFPENSGDLIIEKPDLNVIRDKGVRIIFSALPSGSAGKIEDDLRNNGFYVFTNAGAHRYDPDVPILVPDINPGSIKLIEDQGFPKKGFIVTNPNCSTAGLAVALGPLKTFGIEEITISTYQAISGAGYPGISAMDISGNVIPHIEGEEEKLEKETKKILEIDPEILASCVRVPTLYGHLETVWIRFSDSPDTGDILNAWSRSIPEFNIPSLTKRSVKYLDDPEYPDNHFAFRGDPSGMQVYTGSLKKRENKIGFNIMVNNLIRGGAGGSVANAELFYKVYGSDE